MIREEVIRLVSREVDYNPDLLEDLFMLITTKWQKMAEAQKDNRESLHRFALGEMLDNMWAMALSNKRKKHRLFTNMECCTVLDALDAVDPQCKGGSPARLQLLQHLADSFRALGWTPDCTFISSIRKKSELVANLYKNFPGVST